MSLTCNTVLDLGAQHNDLVYVRIVKCLLSIQGVGKTVNHTRIHLNENWKWILEVHLLLKGIKCSVCKSEYNAILIIQPEYALRMISSGYSHGGAISTGQWIKSVINSMCTIPPCSIKTRIPIFWLLFLHSQLVNVKPAWYRVSGSLCLNSSQERASFWCWWTSTLHGSRECYCAQE